MALKTSFFSLSTRDCAPSSARARRQLLGITIATAVGMALFGEAVPAVAVELPNPETAGNRLAGLNLCCRMRVGS